MFDLNTITWNYSAFYLIMHPHYDVYWYRLFSLCGECFFYCIFRILTIYTEYIYKGQLIKAHNITCHLALWSTFCTGTECMEIVYHMCNTSSWFCCFLYSRRRWMLHLPPMKKPGMKDRPSRVWIPSPRDTPTPRVKCPLPVVRLRFNLQ